MVFAFLVLPAALAGTKAMLFVADKCLAARENKTLTELDLGPLAVPMRVANELRSDPRVLAGRQMHDHLSSKGLL